MRLWIICLGVLVAGPAVAGTATLLSFGETNPGQEITANGVAASKAGGFILYSHGHWTLPALAEPPQVASSAAIEGPRPSAAATAADASSPLLVDNCVARPIPWRTGLSMRTLLGRATYWPIVRAAECRHGLPGGLLDALVLQESRYQPAAVSRAGASGLAQLMPATAADLGVSNRFDPVANVDAGARYLRSMLNRYNSVPLALAAYNAGLGAVDRARGIPANAETPGYVNRVIKYWHQVVELPAAMMQPSRAVSLAFNTTSPE